MKIWIKVIIAGIIIFFIGVFYITAAGGAMFMAGFPGLIISLIGGVVFVVGVLAGLQRGYRRMMGE